MPILIAAAARRARPARGRDPPSFKRAAALRVGAAGARAQGQRGVCVRSVLTQPPFSPAPEMVTPLVKHKIVKKRLKPFLRNQSDGKLAMGVRAPNGRLRVARGRQALRPLQPHWSRR